MRRKVEIPCAQSEPVNLQDEVVSALLRRAGTLMDRQQSSFSPTLFQAAVNNLLAVVEEDSDLAQLLGKLPQALGNGILLPTVFARLFSTQPQPIANPLPAWSENPKLGRREVQVLQELAKGRLQKEIPQHLPPTKNGKPMTLGTVKKHIRHVYEKLQVASPQEAVAKAAALGLLPLDLGALIRPMQDRKDLSFNPFAAPMLTGIDFEQKTGRSEPIRQLAALGLLLFLLAPLRGFVRYTHAGDLQRKGIIFEFTPEGHPVHSFSHEGNLICPLAFAFAPATAERHGFQPGHLFVSDDMSGTDGVNTGRVVEFTPDGSYVRAFTGGAYLSTRLMSSTSMTFTRDGRLLTYSGIYSDAVLEFSEGGRSVRRFIHLVPYGGMAVDSSGNIYIAGGYSRAPDLVHVFNPQGELILKLDVAFGSGLPRGLAVDSRDNLLVAKFGDHVIEVYDTVQALKYAQKKDHHTDDGDPVSKTFDARRYLVRCIEGGGLQHPYRLAVSPKGPLYILERPCRAVKVFDLRRNKFLKPFFPPQEAQLNNLTFGPNGNLFVAAVLLG